VESSTQIPVDAALMPNGIGDSKVRPAADAVTMRSGNGRGKVRLLTRQNLDGRTAAAKQFSAIAEAICEDLGGSDRLSTVQKHLVEAFAGAALCVHTLNAKLLLGQQVDVTEVSQAVSAMVRIASKLGCDRVPRDVTTLGDILKGAPHG
jgi:hypothetical protein